MLWGMLVTHTQVVGCSNNTSVRPAACVNDISKPHSVQAWCEHAVGHAEYVAHMLCDVLTSHRPSPLSRWGKVVHSSATKDWKESFLLAVRNLGMKVDRHTVFPLV